MCGYLKPAFGSIERVPQQAPIVISQKVSRQLPRKNFG